MKILLSWSSGKDSAWALHLLNLKRPGAVAALLTTVNDSADRVAIHGVRRSVLEAQARATGLPLRTVLLPDPCSNDVYEVRLREAFQRAVADGFTHVAFGDLYLDDIRRYRETLMAGSGLAPLFPVWGIPTDRLAQQMMTAGLRARLSCVDTRLLGPSFAGREYNATLLADLPAGADPCGENGEFHTCVCDGPMFKTPLRLELGRLEKREPFAWIDLALEQAVGAACGAVTYPRRIVCLTEETTETLYLLGQDDRVVGVSGYTVRPPEARKKPRVSSFLNARYEKIDALEPDLILAFSDLQAGIAADLGKRGYPVMLFNQRSVREILQMIRMVGALVGCAERGDRLASDLERDLDDITAAGAALPFRPRVYFEEWDDPLISGIRWVEELIEIAGGEPIFPELRHAKLGKDRIIDASSVIGRNPQAIVASWCGKPVRGARIAGRPGWDAVDAVRHGHIYEIKSALILQPGPAALTEGVRQLHAIISGVATGSPAAHHNART